MRCNSSASAAKGSCGALPVPLLLPAVPLLALPLPAAACRPAGRRRPYQCMRCPTASPTCEGDMGSINTHLTLPAQRQCLSVSLGNPAPEIVRQLAAHDSTTLPVHNSWHCLPACPPGQAGPPAAPPLRASPASAGRRVPSPPQARRRCAPAPAPRGGQRPARRRPCGRERAGGGGERRVLPTNPPAGEELDKLYNHLQHRPSRPPARLHWTLRTGPGAGRRHRLWALQDAASCSCSSVDGPCAINTCGRQGAQKGGCPRCRQAPARGRPTHVDG